MDFSIILPAYNEAGNLPQLLRDLKNALDPLGIIYEIIVVDNGSTDNTSEVLNSLKEEIPQLRGILWPNKGFGWCVLHGLSAARGDALGFMDADKQIEPRYIAEIYQKLKNDRLDFCKAVRISRGDSRERRAVSRIYNFLFRLVFDISAKDINGKPKVFTRGLYGKLDLVSRDWFLDAEIMIKAKKEGCLSGEVPIVFLAREGGESGIRPYTILEFLRNMIYWRFKV